MLNQYELRNIYYISCSVILRASSAETDNKQSTAKEFSPGFGWSQEGSTPSDGATSNMMKDNITTDSASNSSNDSKYVRYPSLGSPNNKIATYHFNIGTVESFERKLEEAQRNLGCLLLMYYTIC